MTLASMPATSVRSERAYEKYSWVAFSPGILFFLAIGLGLTISPGTVEPTAPATDVRLSGLALIGLTVFSSAIITTSFRRGEKWAWFSLWYYPVFLAAIFAINNNDPYWTTNSSLFLALSLVALLLPYRKFFPRK